MCVRENKESVRKRRSESEKETEREREKERVRVSSEHKSEFETRYYHEKIMRSFQLRMEKPTFVTSFSFRLKLS